MAASHVILAGDVMDQKHGLNLPVLLAVNERPGDCQGDGDPHHHPPGNHISLTLNARTTPSLSAAEERHSGILPAASWRGRTIASCWFRDASEQFRRLQPTSPEVITSRKKRIPITHVSLAEEGLPSNS